MRANLFLAGGARWVRAKLLRKKKSISLNFAEKKVRLKEGWYVMFLAGGPKVGESEFLEKKSKFLRILQKKKVRLKEGWCVMFLAGT